MKDDDDDDDGRGGTVTTAKVTLARTVVVSATAKKARMAWVVRWQRPSKRR